jgi:hypothetical protein
LFEPLRPGQKCATWPVEQFPHHLPLSPLITRYRSRVGLPA